MPNGTQSDMGASASYLREQAQRCMRLARGCPHLPTCHELEAVGIELMQKAAEVDDLLNVRPEASGATA